MDKTIQSSTEIKLLGAGDEAVMQAVAPDVFDDALDPRHHVAVALAEGRVVGFVSAVHYVHPDKPRPELWISEVGVAPSHQGQGIARRLMEAVLHEARDLGCSTAWVLTERTNTNTAAMRLYSSCGGVEAPQDAVMFEFEL